MGMVLPLVVSLRPWQWVKNGVLLMPFIFSVNSAWRPGDTALVLSLLKSSLAGLAVFCLVSGAVYLVNDVVDRRGDRAHPKKSRRPIASGALPVAVALAAAVVLAGLGLAWSLLLHPGFAAIIVGYVGLNVGYSVHLKKVVILDVMIVASGYVLRMAAGSVLLGIPTSPWLYMTLGLGALFIALGKRESEVLLAGAGASGQRRVLGSYTPELLRLLLGVTTTGTLLTYGLFLFNAEATTLPSNHSMFLTFPMVIFGLFRYLYLIEVAEGAESPELIILKDPPLVLALLSWGITGLVVLLLNR
jgi:4-hydroxybenzoate polyprenyltransferase